MKGTCIEWDVAFPAEVKAAVEPMLKKYLHLVPRWCHTIHIDYKAEAEDGTAAENATDPEYRKATITFCAAWLDETPQARRRAVLHELLHIVLAPMARFTECVLDGTSIEGTKKILDEQWRISYEGAVEDLTTALLDE